MSKRLLSEETALRKIELSLKLQGKAFKPDFIGCHHCKFYWGNRNDQPQWVRKYGWHCYIYKGTPYHAYLRFKVVRFNAEGVQIRRQPWYNPTLGHWVYTPHNDEYDKMILVSSGSHWQYSVCRRFEASAPK